VDLSVATRETVVIVGPSGAGKSTILKMIAGLVTPDRGSLRFPGLPEGSRPRIGLSPQTPGLLPWLDLFENVLVLVKLNKNARTPDFELQARDLLCRFGMKGAEKIRPHALSGGMQSRGALVRALIGGNDLLLLDEPFGSLDDVTAETILLDLTRHLASFRQTTIMVSHNLTQAAFLADRILILSPSPGRIVGQIQIDAGQPRDVSFLNSPPLHTAVAEARAILRQGAI
jgi:NitT/TauT family transport system ATP-binding protein